jgi:hypothetical protein
MYETWQGEVANMNINRLDEVSKPLQIQEQAKRPINSDCDPFKSYLPPEIISHIFAIYTEKFNSRFNLREPSIKCSGPLLLGAISKLWREVAFGTPQLWNTINICVRPLTNDITPKIELTKQWLDRSKQLPLCLSLTILIIYDSQIGPATHSLIPLFSLLRSFAPRWHLLSLEFPPRWYATFLDDLTCAPHLDTLKLIVAEPELEDGGFRLSRTPSLKHLDVSYNYLSQISVEWGNITNFEANDLSTDELFELLRLAGQLTSCSLHGTSWNIYQYSIPTTPITHSALKQFALVLNVARLEEMKNLFDLLILPSLERFAYEDTKTYIFPLNSLISLFNRSRCQLTHLDLTRILLDRTMGDLISLFSTVPTITHLKLEHIEDRSDQPDGIMTDKLLQKLTPIEGIRSGLLPYLQSLKFRGKQTFSWKCLADFIISRLAEENNDGFVNINTTDKTNTGRNSPVFQHQNTSRNPLRLVSFMVISPGLLDLNSLVRFNHARDAGVSIEIWDENLHNCLHSV